MECKAITLPDNSVVVSGDWFDKMVNMEMENIHLRQKVEALAELERYFTSGNDVPVERATINASDFWKIVGN